MSGNERELGEITARLKSIESRLEEHEGDVKDLNKTTSELAKTIATLAGRIAIMPLNSQPDTKGGLIGLSAGIGGVFGAGITKALSFFGIP